jgi:hypothetical protein
MASFSKAPSRRSAVLYHNPPDAGVILQLVDITHGATFTFVEIRALSTGVSVEGSSDPVKIGYWFFSGLLNGVNSGVQANLITAGAVDSEGQLFTVRFLGLFDLNAIWTIQAPRIQHCILGGNGGVIAGAIGEGQTMGGFVGGSVFIPQNDGAPYYPPLIFIEHAHRTGTPQLDVNFTTLAGVAAPIVVTGVPPWSCSNGTVVISATAMGPATVRLIFSGPIAGPDFLVVPAYTTGIRGTLGQFVSSARTHML